jgi:hypothetical protein
MSKYSTEVIRQVWDDAYGVFLQIGPDDDGIGLIQMETTTAKAIEFYGKVRLLVTPEMAVLLGKALIAAGEEGMAAEPEHS